MKKILTHLTGIVFLITILIAGGFTSADNPCEPTEYPEIVTIYLKAYEVDGEMKLKMYDSKNEKPIVAEDHVAEVGPETRVVWRRANESGIRTIKKAGPKESEIGPIFPGDATTILLNKRRRIRVPDNAPVPSRGEEGIRQEYEIKFKDKKYNREWTTDPYLEIPPP